MQTEREGRMVEAAAIASVRNPLYSTLNCSVCAPSRYYALRIRTKQTTFRFACLLRGCETLLKHWERRNPFVSYYCANAVHVYSEMNFISTFSACTSHLSRLLGTTTCYLVVYYREISQFHSRFYQGFLKSRALNYRLKSRLIWHNVNYKQSHLTLIAEMPNFELFRPSAVCQLQIRG